MRLITSRHSGSTEYQHQRSSPVTTALSCTMSDTRACAYTWASRENTAPLPTYTLLNVVVCNEPLIRQAGRFRNSRNKTFRAIEDFSVTNFSSRDIKGGNIRNELRLIKQHINHRKTARTFAFVLFATTSLLLFSLDALRRDLRRH